MQIPIQTGRIKTTGCTMEYFRFGHGRETLVILSGLSVQSVMNAADAAADAYRLLTDDLRSMCLTAGKICPPRCFQILNNY